MKTCIVVYDETDKPYKIVEVRTFTDAAYPSFKSLCDTNAKTKKARDAKKAEEAAEAEKERIARMNKRVAKIAYLLALDDYSKGDLDATSEDEYAFEEAIKNGQALNDDNAVWKAYEAYIADLKEE